MNKKQRIKTSKSVVVPDERHSEEENPHENGRVTPLVQE